MASLVVSASAFGFFWAPPPPPPPPSLLEEWSPTLVWLTGWLGFVLTLAMTQAPTARVMAAMEVMTNSMYLGHFALQGAMGGLA